MEKVGEQEMDTLEVEEAAATDLSILVGPMEGTGTGRGVTEVGGTAWTCPLSLSSISVKCFLKNTKSSALAFHGNFGASNFMIGL